MVCWLLTILVVMLVGFTAVARSQMRGLRDKRGRGSSVIRGFTHGDFLSYFSSALELL